MPHDPTAIKPKSKKNNPKTELWLLKFDGSRSKQGNGVGIELTNPKGRVFLTSYHLQFTYTNNVIEYEALIRGLLLALRKGTKAIKVGDSELIFKQARIQYKCHERRLSAYRNRVWSLIEYFDTFNILLVPCIQNSIPVALAVVASTLKPVNESPLKIFLVK